MVDLHQGLPLGAVEIVLEDQNLLAQVAEGINLRRIEMTIIGKSLMTDVQNPLEVIDTKMRGDQCLLDQAVEVINTGMKDAQDLGLATEMIDIKIKGVQGHLDPGAEVTGTRKIDAQDLLAILHDGAPPHLHTQGIGKAVGIMMKGDLVLQGFLGPGENVIVEIIQSPINALEYLALVTTLLKETLIVYSQSMGI